MERADTNGTFIHLIKYLPIPMYLAVPFVILKIFNLSSNYTYGIHESISEVGIIVLLFLFLLSDKKANTNLKILLVTFCSVLVADGLYMATITSLNRESLFIVYLSEIFYILFFGGLLSFLLINTWRYLTSNKFTLTYTVFTFLVLLSLYMKFTLFPLYSRVPPPTTFYIFSCTISTILEVGIASLAIPLILRSTDELNLLFLQTVVLMCAGDFAIRYETSFVSKDSALSGSEYVWAISMASFFILFMYFKRVPSFSEEKVTNNWSIRTLISFFILVSLLLFLVILDVSGLKYINNAFTLSRMLIIIVTVWFIANFVSIYVSKAIHKNINSFKLSLWNSLSPATVTKPETYISELQNILKNYNVLSEKTDLLNNEITKLSKFETIGRTTQLLAHDIKHPFSQIKLTLSMFDSFRSDPIKLEQAKIEINNSIKGVEAMLSELIESTKEITLNIEPIAVKDIINESIGSIKENVKLNQIKITNNINEQQKILGDRYKLVRCFSNIIENALDSIIEHKQGLGVVEIASRIISPKHLEITLSNNGPIIAEEDLPKLFDSFFTKGKKKGLGLGLASCHRIISLHKGQIIAKNRASAAGVEFIITLPTHKTM